MSDCTAKKFLIQVNTFTSVVFFVACFCLLYYFFFQQGCSFYSHFVVVHLLAFPKSLCLACPCCPCDQTSQVSVLCRWDCTTGQPGLVQGPLGDVHLIQWVILCLWKMHSTDDLDVSWYFFGGFFMTKNLSHNTHCLLNASQLLAVVLQVLEKQEINFSNYYFTITILITIQCLSKKKFSLFPALLRCRCAKGVHWVTEKHVGTQSPWEVVRENPRLVLKVWGRAPLRRQWGQ